MASRRELWAVARRLLQRGSPRSPGRTVNHVDTANKFFLVLTIIADVGVVVLGPVALSMLRTRPVTIGEGGLRAGLLEWIGPQARALAFVVAAMATAGSLYYSEIAHFVPCELCWYQRICMYPLAAILLVGLLRRDSAVRWYAAPFVLVGAPLSLYHWLVERVPAFADTSSCSAVAPCTTPYFEELGFVTLAFMAFSGFLLVGTLLLMDRAYDRAVAAEEPGETEVSTEMETV
jgi:disulfide bond formation protein DsbB